MDGVDERYVKEIRIARHRTEVPGQAAVGCLHCDSRCARDEGIVGISCVYGVKVVRCRAAPVELRRAGIGWAIDQTLPAYEPDDVIGRGIDAVDHVGGGRRYGAP